MQPIFTEEIDKVRWVRQQEVDRKTDDLIKAGYTFIYNGIEYTLDTTEKSLAKLGIAYNVAKQMKEAGQPYAQKTVMNDYKVIEMDGDSIISTYENMITYGLGLYNQHSDLIESLKDLSLEELKAWKDPRDIEKEGR